MPKVISHTPPWLSRPSPGASLFTSKTPQALPNKSESVTEKNEHYEGPHRTLARRGLEVFVVVDNQIRWSDLSTLQSQWQAHSKPKPSKTGTGLQKTAVDNAPGTTDRRAPYKVLTVPVYGQIRQLLVSPNGAFMAVLTARTVHIAVLPDHSHLSSPDNSSIRLKTYQLGPTTHVIPESPVVSAIWHPLGVYTNLTGCIITVTADAAVRIWELDRNNHWSFDQPTLAIDLKKLVDGTSSDEDFSPAGFGKNKGFSADSFDMEVASATFGGSGEEGEDAWAPMTLWVSMRPGDVYALCPLLPLKWQAPPTTIPSLSAAIIPKLSALEQDTAEDEDELIACRQQFEWLKEIDSQDGTPGIHEADNQTAFEILKRPQNPSAIPRLQGPFHFDFEDQVEDMEDGLDVTDINVIPSKLDLDELMTGEDDENSMEEGSQGLSATVICLTTTSGRVHVCLETEGVEGQWLPRTKSNKFTTPVSEPADLVLLESLDTVPHELQQSNAWPTFTKDAFSRYGFFVTSAKNVTFVSLSSWVERLEAELQSEDAAGSAFRLNVLCEGSIALREVIIKCEDVVSWNEQSAHLSSSLVFNDLDLEYFLLTYRDSTPYAALLELPYIAPLTELSRPESESIGGQIVVPSQRAAYQVPAVFYADNPIENFVERHVPHRHRQMLREQVRLSPLTLDLVAAAHRHLSAHTLALEKAASDLFRRCERLQGEMRDQIEQIAEISERISSVSSEIGPDNNLKTGSRSEDALDRRLVRAKERQEELSQRYNSLRNKVLNSGGRPLGDKEKAWIAEVEALSASIEGGKKMDAQSPDETLYQRLETAKSLASDLLTEYKRALATTTEPSSLQSSMSESTAPVTSPNKAQSQPRIPPRLQRQRIADAMKMVERETAVIDAITSRLERLNTSIP